MGLKGHRVICPSTGALQREGEDTGEQMETDVGVYCMVQSVWCGYLDMSED